MFITIHWKQTNFENKSKSYTGVLTRNCNYLRNFNTAIGIMPLCYNINNNDLMRD